MTFTVHSVPDQRGRTAIVTGANTGLGFETARVLAERGATVILACRDPQKGDAALARIRAEMPSAQASVEALDLSDLDSVRDFAARFEAAHARLDLLIANAGVMAPPKARTKQGFELQFGTNHLGHFALTGHLLPLLEKTPKSRVVVVSSIAHRFGSIELDDLSFEKRGYNAGAAYGQSKLANLLFVLELGKRLTQRGSTTLVTAAHPGWTATELQRYSALARVGNALFAMKPIDGALPTLRAATDPTAEMGTYYGPSRFFEVNGPPEVAKKHARAEDEAMAAALFQRSEELTGVRFGARGEAASRAMPSPG
jgi:NAD(P)-dependent dehydrogenase (short-subunit alcohol dehydrogenase family)